MARIEIKFSIDEGTLLRLLRIKGKECNLKIKDDINIKLLRKVLSTEVKDIVNYDLDEIILDGVDRGIYSEFFQETP